MAAGQASCIEEPGTSAYGGAEVILVVDDEEIVRDIAKCILEDEGYDVLIAKDGLEAVELFRDYWREVAAVLLDVTMPGLDGAGTFLAMRSIRPDVRIVFSSGFDHETVIERFCQEPSVGFIQKPYRAAQLVGQLRSMTGG